jgi:hypothetical protein
MQRNASDEEAEGMWVSDEGSDVEMKPKEAKKPKEIWNDKETPLAEDEELIYDGSAY